MTKASPASKDPNGIKKWLFGVISPLLLVIGLDQLTKHWAISQTDIKTFGFIDIITQTNSGFLLGSLADKSELYTIVVPSTIGAFLLFIFFVIQYFTPFLTLMFRVGLSIFMGGVLSNIGDRIFDGQVVDFIYITTRFFSTGVFNLADLFQWIGVCIYGCSYFINGRILFPVDQRRGRKWIDPKFQLRYCLTLIAAGAGFAIIAGVLASTFLKFALSQVTIADPNIPVTRDLLVAFIEVYLAMTGTFLVMLFLLGVHLSHRVAGPIKAFENFLNGLMAGDVRALKLRRSDELHHLEVLADKFYQQFHERLGIEPPPLEIGVRAPDFTTATLDGRTVSLNDFCLFTRIYG